MEFLREFPDIERLDIFHFLDGAKIKVAHANFLPLINKRGTPQREEQESQSFAAFFAVTLLISKTGDGTGLIMIFKIIGIPVQLFLPAAQRPEETPGRKAPQKPFDAKTICLHVVKGKDLIQLAPLRKGQISRLFRRHKDCLPHGKAVVTAENLCVKALQETMQTGRRQIVLATRQRGTPAPILQRFLIKNVYNIAAKAIYPTLQPEAHDVLNGLDNCFIVVIEIGLFPGKKMEIILPAQLIEGPDIPSEKTAPVIGFASLFALTPDIEIRIRFNPLPALLKPLVLIRSVINHQIHDDFNIAAVSFRDELVHLLQRPELWVNVAIIADIITVIHIRRRIKRRKPEHAHTQVF